VQATRNALVEAKLEDFEVQIALFLGDSPDPVVSLTVFGEVVAIFLENQSGALLAWATLLSLKQEWLALKVMNFYLSKYLRRLDTPEQELFEASVALLLITPKISDPKLHESTLASAKDILSTPANLFQAAVQIETK